MHSVENAFFFRRVNILERATPHKRKWINGVRDKFYSSPKSYVHFIPRLLKVRVQHLVYLNSGGRIWHRVSRYRNPTDRRRSGELNFF